MSVTTIVSHKFHLFYTICIFLPAILLFVVVIIETRTKELVPTVKSVHIYTMHVYVTCYKNLT
jgi:hypothetical protein